MHTHTHAHMQTNLRQRHRRRRRRSLAAAATYKCFFLQRSVAHRKNVLQTNLVQFSCVNLPKKDRNYNIVL